MSSPTTYFITSTSGFFINWHVTIPGLETKGQSLEIKGSIGNDEVFVGLGTIVDATKMTSTSGNDAIYLIGKLSDYETSHVGSQYTVFRTVDGFLESVTFFASTGDRLYFADGSMSISPDDLKITGTSNFKNLKNITPTGKSTPDALADISVIKTPTSPTKVFITDINGTNINSGIIGSIFEIKGSIGDDTVYVKLGTIVDATKMTSTSGNDAIYLTGNFQDYTNTHSGSQYTFTKTVNLSVGGVDYIESVTFFASTKDKLYFANGFVNIGGDDLRVNGAFVDVTDGTNGTTDMFIEKTIILDLGIALTITDDKANTVKSGETITYTFIFAEPVTNFDLADITVKDDNTPRSDANAKGVFTAVTGETGVTDGTKYTLVVTPDADFEGNLVVSVAKDVAVSGNTKNLAASTTQVVDTKAPTATVKDITEIAGTDKIINAAERAADITIKGILDVDFAAGEKVIVTINGKSYDATSTIGANTWTVNIPQADIASIASGNVTAKLIDSVGNASATKTVAFIVDTTAPSVATFSADILSDANLTITFNEDIVIGTGNLSIYKETDNSKVVDIAVNSSLVTLGIDKKTLTINPTTDLDPGTEYYIKIDTTAFKDTAGNNYAGIDNNSSWKFTVLSFTSTAQWVNASGDSVSDNGINATELSTLAIQGTLTNPSRVRGITISAIVFKAASGDANNVSVAGNLAALDSTNGTWTLAHNNIPTLNSGETYTIEVSLSATDGKTSTSGNTTPVLIDTTAPTMTGWAVSSPTSGQTSFKVGDVITLTTTTNEPLSLSSARGKVTIARKEFALDTTQGAAKTRASADELKQLVFTYTVLADDNVSKADFEITDANAIVLTGVTDVAGNKMVATGTYPVELDRGIDGVMPSILSFSSSTDDGTYKAGDSISISATASEIMQAGSKIVVTLNTNATVELTATAEGTTLTGIYTVAANQNNADLTVSSFSLGTGSNRPMDASGNVMTDTSVPTGNNNLADVKAIVIDTTAPIADYSGDITPVANLVITFVEAVEKVAGKEIKIYKDGETTASQTITLASDTSDGVTITNNNTFTINPTDDLAKGNYYVKIEAGAFKDTTGNDYAGISNTTDWAFTSKSLVTSVVWSGTGVDISNGINATEYNNITITGKLAAGTLSGAKITSIKFIAQDDSANTKEYTTEIIPTADNGTWILDKDKVKVLGLVNNETYKIEVMLSAPSGSSTITDTSSNNTLVLIDTTAPVQTISDIGISTDTGAITDDFITNTATQTITATLSEGLSSNEKLYYRLDGVVNVGGNLTDWIQVTSSDINNNNISIVNLTLIAGADKKIAFKVIGVAGNESVVAEQAYTLDTTPPDAVDLSTDNGGQSTSTTFVNITAMSAGVAFDADIQAPTATDIKTIQVVLGGVGLNTDNDKLVLNLDFALNADITTATGKTIGGVSGLEYSYIASSKTWTISKTLGNLTAINVESIVEALKLKNIDINSQKGVRTATISYIDMAGNKGISAMASLEAELSRGFVMNGEESRDYAGNSVSCAGDVNGDGLDDLIVGAADAGSNGGKSYVVFGKTDGTAINFNAIVSGTGGFVINGEKPNDRSGTSVSSAGDVNGDGLDDLIVGAYSANPSNKRGAGKSYVVFGKTDTNVINLSTIASGTGGFVINGETAWDYSGNSVSCAGDVNGDGLDDLIVGVKNANSKTGKSYVVFGKTDTDMINLSAIASGTGGFVINGETNGDESGISVSSAGDVNGDGLDDLIVGAYNANEQKGKSYVVFGKTDTDVINLSAIASGTGGFVINGEAKNDWSGYSVSSAGDVNGDGLDDLIVGAHHAATNNKDYAGKSYVVFGKTDTSVINLSAIASSTGGFVINGESAGDISGYSVSSAGDVNGDGLDDLIVGAYGANGYKGKSYVVFGKTDNTAVNLSDITSGTGGFVINGEAKDDESGYSVSSAGDVNGDGLDDLIVGARNADLDDTDDTDDTDDKDDKDDTGEPIKPEPDEPDEPDDKDDTDEPIKPEPNDKSFDEGKSYVIFGKTDTKAINLSRLGDDSKYTIDKQGTTGNDTLTGTNKDEIFVAGAGNDTLTGNGGMDVFSAGAGDDTIIINTSNLTALEKTGAGNRANINGGGGIDTLKLDGSGLTLDFTNISNNRIKDIEKIDLIGSGDNTFKVNLNDVLDASTSTNILKVLGDSGDKVDIDTSKWTDSTVDKTEDGVNYNVYTHADVNTGANAALWIDTDLSVI